MHIFITGGSGFIGSHLTQQALNQNHQVTIYDLKDPKSELLSAGAKYIKGDIKDQKLLQESLPGVDVVVHMASLLEVNESVREPMRYAENNILGTITLLEAMKEVGVKKIIFSSSATVYGVPEKLPLTETSPVLAVNPYGVTKVAIENLLSSYHFNHDFDVTILRYFNPYGPGSHNPTSLAIPNFVRAALKKQPIPLYWNGEQVRDFIYVEDLACAHLAVLDLTGWNIFNIGTGTGIKIMEIIKTIEKILGYPLEIEDKGKRAGDVPANYASSAKLIEATGWEPATTLIEGLTETINWEKLQLS